MNVFKKMLVRQTAGKVEKTLNLKAGEFQPIALRLAKKGQSIKKIRETVLGCLQWMQLYGQDNFLVAMELYAACLENPKPDGAADQDFLSGRQPDPTSTAGG